MSPKNPVRLTLINKTQDLTPKHIAVLDKSEATAWRVFELASLEKTEPFLYTALEINVSDQYGNYTLIQPAQHEDDFYIVDSPSGIELQVTDGQMGRGEIRVTNSLKSGAMNVHFFRNEILFAEQFGLVPGQKMHFKFGDKLSVGIVEGIVEGQMLDEKMLENFETQFSMIGIQSADIVLSGGGGEVVIALENVSMHC
jgi:hypothetical protein